MRSATSFAALGLVAKTAAHGYIDVFTVNNEAFEGFRRHDAPPIPGGIGWSFSTNDEGPVLDETSPDMICRHDAENALNSAQIAAGQTVDFSWTSADTERNPLGWAESHKGPVITYLAACNGPCETVDKTSLRWVKIAEAGLISGPANQEGVWAADLLREGSNSATIPSSIAPGNYVIRNEIIALHRANVQEPEFYQVCANLEVTSGGDDDLSGKGVAATELYSRNDQQIFDFSLYADNGDTWTIPGPPMYQASTSGETPDNTNDNPAPSASPGSGEPAVGPCGQVWRA